MGFNTKKIAVISIFLLLWCIYVLGVLVVQLYIIIQCDASDRSSYCWDVVLNSFNMAYMYGRRPHFVKNMIKISNSSWIFIMKIFNVKKDWLKIVKAVQDDISARKVPIWLHHTCMFISVEDIEKWNNTTRLDIGVYNNLTPPLVNTLVALFSLKLV